MDSIARYKNNFVCKNENNSVENFAQFKITLLNTRQLKIVAVILPALVNTSVFHIECKQIVKLNA